MTAVTEAIWARQVMQPLTQPPPVTPERAPLLMPCPACGRTAAWHWRYRTAGGATDYGPIDCDCQLPAALGDRWDFT